MSCPPRALRAWNPRPACRILVPLLLAAILSLAANPAAAQETLPTYQKIQIDWPLTQQEWTVLGGFPDLEPMEVERDRYIRYLSRPELTEALRQAGLSPTVLVEDLRARYASQIAGGGWGAFYTLDEVGAALDSLHTVYPTITTPKFSIGNSLEGRPIWAIKMSDNPGVDEDEPEVFFDAAHHAREVATPATVIGYLRYLGSNYGVDPEATYIVDEREIWVVPVVNPDGYYHNEVTDPGGGGLWRKNRRDNPGSCEGVDLNRNYSVGFGGSGSSGSYCDETYRGTAAFSEPETQVMRDFMNARNFVTHNSYHSVVPVILFPWGYTSTHCPDHATFDAIAQEMATGNGYPWGPAGEVLYIASGNTFDWEYQTHGTFAFTTEVSGGDFWPPESALPGIVAENLYSNVYLSLIAGSYVRAQSVAVTGGNGNGRLDPGEAASIEVTLENPGLLAGASGVTLTISSDDAYVQILDAASAYGTIAAGGSASNGADPFQVLVDAASPEGHEAVFRLSAAWNDGENNEETTLTIGPLPVILSDDGESGNPGWSQDPSHSASTGDWVLIDPNPTAYQPGDDTTPPPGTMAWITGQNTGGEGTDDVDNGISAMRSPVWDLSGYTHVELAFNWFHGQRDAGDDTEDFFRVDLSNDGGATYPVNLILLGDVPSAANWTPFSVNLEERLPLTANMRVRLQASDGPSTGDIIEGGLDDLFLVDRGSGNAPPEAPVLASPGEGATVMTGAPALVVDNAVDPESDPLTYGFRVYDDALLTHVVAGVDGVAEGAGQTAWAVGPALADGDYWWRAYAEDAEERGLFAAARSFTVEAATDVASSPAESESFLRPASPNPFAEQTTVRFALPVQTRVRAEIYDASGRRVKLAYHGVMPAGVQSLHWDGADDHGRPAAAGVYFLLLRIGDEERSVKLTVAR